MKIIRLTAVTVLVLQFFFASSPGEREPQRDLQLFTGSSPLEKQVAAYVGYPKVLRQANWEGVVVVGLRISKQSRIARVTVYAENEPLRVYLVNQLEGKILHGVRSKREEQLVKLRFTLR
jgi:hypothetical protein